MKPQLINSPFVGKMSSTIAIAIFLLLTDVSPLIQAAETEIPPSNYVSSYSGAVTNDYPTNLVWWIDFRPTGDYGAMVNEHVTWDGTTFEYSNVLIFPEADTNGATVFHTNSGTSYWSVSTNGVWAYSWKLDGGGSETNLPSSRPDWLFQRAEANRIQTGHVTITESILADNTSVYTTTTVTNATTLMLNTGKVIDTTYPHLFRLKVRVWDTTDPANEAEYSPSVIRELGITPDPQGYAPTNFDDNVAVNITPSLVGVASNDTRFTVDVEKLKVRFGAQAGKMCEGYDPKPGTTTNHATSLAIGGTNQITELQIPADWALDLIELKVTGAITVSQTNNFTSRTTALTIISTSTNATLATIEAQYKTNHVTLAKLDVLILPTRIFSVDIFRVEDPGSPKTALGECDDNTAIISMLNQIYKQACVQFQDVSQETEGQAYQVTYDTNPSNGLFDKADEASMLSDLWLGSQADFHLVILAASSLTYPDPDPGNPPTIPAALKYARGAFDGIKTGYAFISTAEYHLGSVFAHEIAHLIRINDNEHVNKPWPPNEEHVFRDGAPEFILGQWFVQWPGNWFRVEDWVKINSFSGVLP